MYHERSSNSSPPNLSPEAMDSDPMEQDCSSTESQIGTPDKNRSRRKPTLEDIVRRMKEVENGYYSGESDGEEDEENETNGLMIFQIIFFSEFLRRRKFIFIQERKKIRW
jgi:hypothetical protein